jgi:hypothetical protein
VLFRPGRRGAFVPDRAMSAAAWDDVRARTGWPLPAVPPEPFEADPGEVRVLRRFVDPGGLLAAGKTHTTADAGKQS